jgi:hypothetical protein
MTPLFSHSFGLPACLQGLLSGQFFRAKEKAKKNLFNTLSFTSTWAKRFKTLFESPKPK